MLDLFFFPASCEDFQKNKNTQYLWRGLLLLLLLLVMLRGLLVGGSHSVLRMRMMVGMKALGGGLVSLKGPEGPRDELRGQRVEDVRLLELQGLQLSLDLLEGDAVQAGVLVAD